MGNVMKIPINKLKPHPQNQYYFDDITGEDWNSMIRSIKTSGVRVPLTVTQDYIIVSGHQRVRACRELGVNEVPVIVQEYAAEDEVLKDLIEINIIQRGIGNPNPVKFGRCILELERIYGIRSGSANPKGTVIGESNNFTDGSPSTEQEFADRIGITRQSLQNYKKLAQLIPEVEDFLDTGMISPTTALAVAKQLSAEDQLKFVSQLDATRKYTAKEIQPYIDQIRQLKSKPAAISDYEEVKHLAEEYMQKNVSLERENSDLQSKYNRLLSQQALDKKEIEELRKARYVDPEKAADSAFDLWKITDKFVKEVLSPFYHDEAVTKYQDGSGEFIFRACNTLIDAATDILRRFKTETIDADVVD